MLQWTIAISAFLVAASAAHAEELFRVTLLGTGTPNIRLDRLGPATLVEAGNQKLLFDAGRSVSIRLTQAKVPPGRLDALFITHYHSDHTTGIADLWLTGWLPRSGERKQPFRVIGPTGANELMTNLQRAYAADVRIRIADQKLLPDGASIAVEEFASDAVVYERDGVRVTAFEVDHGPAIKPAYGYRVDYKGRSVLVSGDTRFSENLIKNGMGVDVLVHAVAGTRPELLDNMMIRRIMDHHTKPDEAAIVFNRTRPKLAVYTHFVQQGTSSVPAPTVADIVAETRKTYSGPLQAGEDLMSFDVSEAGVRINPPPRK